MPTFDPVPSDQALVLLCAAGDEPAWMLLDERQGCDIRATIGLALSLVGKAGHRYLVGEIYTDVLEHLFLNDCHTLHLYDHGRPLKPYLAKVAWHVALDHLRSLRHQEAHEAPLRPGQRAEEQHSLPCVIDEEVKHFVASQSPRLRELFRYLMEGPDNPAPAWLTADNERKWIWRLRQAFLRFLYDL